MRQGIPVRAFSISLFIIRRASDENRVLLLKRLGHTQPGEWCQIAGGIEDGELAWQTALREAKEETGLVLSNLYSADYCEQFYEADRNAITLAPVFVSYVAADCRITLNHEHSEYYWASYSEALRMLPFPGQRRTLESIWAGVVECEPHALLKMPVG